MQDYIDGYVEFIGLNNNEKISSKEKDKRITQEKVLRAIDAVTPGMGDYLLKDLMMCEFPAEALPIQTIRPASSPQLRSGEMAYGYYGIDHNWWIVLENRVVSRIVLQ